MRNTATQTGRLAKAILLALPLTACAGIADPDPRGAEFRALVLSFERTNCPHEWIKTSDVATAVWIVLALTLLSACDVVRRVRYRELADVGQQYFSAASAGDTAALRGLVSGGQALEFARRVRELEPSLLAAGATELSLVTAVSAPHGEAVVALFTVTHGGEKEAISIGFTGERNAWKVREVQLTSRL